MIHHIQAVFNLSNVSPTEKLLLLALANHADGRGECFPSTARLATMTGLNRRSVKRILARLQKQNLLKSEAQFLNGTNYSKPHRYTLLLDGGTGSPYGDTGSPYDIVTQGHHMVTQDTGDGDPVPPHITIREAPTHGTLRHDPQTSLIPDSRPDEKTELDKQVDDFIQRWNQAAPPLGLPTVQDRAGSKTYQTTVKKLALLFEKNTLFRNSTESFFTQLQLGFSFDWRPSLVDLLGNNRTGTPKWEKLISGEYAPRPATAARPGFVPEALKIMPGHFDARKPDSVSGD